MILLSHPTGNQNVRQALKAFQEAGLLAEFVTTVASFEGNVFGHLAKTKLGAEFERRRYKQELAAVTRLQPEWELARMLASRFGLTRFTQHEKGFFCVDAVYRHLDSFAAARVNKLAEIEKLSAVYAYDDGAFETFQVSKRYGLRCIYDLPTTYWKMVQSLLEEEVVRYPDWKCTMGGVRNSEQKFARKEAELQLADVIICPSNFVRDSLPDAIKKSKQVYVIPFGSPEITRSDIRRDIRKTDKMKVLFVGNMSQQKGLADVFAAMKLLDSSQFELHVLGAMIADMSFYHEQFPNFQYHKTRPHPEVLLLMQSCDVLVLPSIAEGRALVQQEALACGLPIIVTKNAGAEDLVEDEQAGFLVPVRNPQAIAEKLELLHRDRERLAVMKEAARAKARQVTWNEYRSRLIEAVS